MISTLRFWGLSDAGVGWHGQLRLALGEHLETVRRNAAGDEASKRRRRTAAADSSRLTAASPVRSAVPVRIMTMGLPSLKAREGVIEHGLVVA